jgi:anti-sigma regulatory factor (Ser/Thr protein kinase)
MVRDICFHIFDLVQNSVAAGAHRVTVTLHDSAASDEIRLGVEDDGRGMDAQTAANARDPFYTSKGFKKVGLGLPLLEATSCACHGEFDLESVPGEGTIVQARLEKSHWDCPPLGDISDTMLELLVTLEGVNLEFKYVSDKGEFSISSAEIHEQAGGLHLSHPDVYSFLREYLNANLRPLLG